MTPERLAKLRDESHLSAMHPWGLKLSIGWLIAELDRTRMSLVRKSFELGADLRADPNDPEADSLPAVFIAPHPAAQDRRPLWCYSAREVAQAWGWGYLYPEEPEDIVAFDRALAIEVAEAQACDCDERHGPGTAES